MPSRMSDPLASLRRRGAQVEAALDAFLARQPAAAPARLIEAIRYSLLAGGKRLRPTLVLEWHALLGRAA
jgi:geranylgeranyl pyrophosphate synthase